MIVRLNTDFGLRQCLGAGPAKPAAGSTDDRFAAGNTEVHASPPALCAPSAQGELAQPHARFKKRIDGPAAARPLGPHGHFATGGIEERIDSTLPPVRSPKTVPRS